MMFTQSDKKILDELEFVCANLDDNSELFIKEGSNNDSISITLNLNGLFSCVWSEDLSGNYSIFDSISLEDCLKWIDKKFKKGKK